MARNMRQPKAAQLVTRSQVAEVATPQHTETHFPLAHIQLVDEVEEQLRSASFEVTDVKHRLTADGSRYFGVMNLQNTEDRDYSFIVGIRNSHDKSCATAIAAGNRVFVCDNMCFYGEIQLERKHTRFAAQELPQLTARVVGQLAPLFGHAEHRIESYRGTVLEQYDSDHLILECLRKQAITNREVDDVMRSYEKPEYDAFAPRNAWSLFNAVTGVHHSIRDERTLVNRGQALHGVFDGFCGVKQFAPVEV